MFSAALPRIPSIGSPNFSLTIGLPPNPKSLPPSQTPKLFPSVDSQPLTLFDILLRPGAEFCMALAPVQQPGGQILARLPARRADHKSSAVPAGSHHRLCAAGSRVHTQKMNVTTLPYSFRQHFLNDAPQPGVVIAEDK